VIVMNTSDRLSTPSLILASASPRRKELLEKAGLKFKVVIPSVDESAFSTDNISACEYAEKLALAKATSVAKKFKNSLVLGADTVVDFNGCIIGKPIDNTDAKQIIRKLFSRPHKVITGIAILRLSDKTKIVTNGVTTVYPKKMTAEQIAEYIKGGLWKEKAGAYGIQETGDKFIEKIDGSLTNVMGLPMELLEQMLKKVNLC